MILILDEQSSSIWLLWSIHLFLVICSTWRIALTRVPDLVS
jgi:hypothetical protein